MPVLLCLCTCPDAATADQLATQLVTARLSACVNVLPGVRSVYRWEDKVERAEEVMLLIKTTGQAYPQLLQHIVQLHPYTTPEVIALPVEGGLPAYLDWVHANTQASA